jgi:hypothetical protein
MDTTIHHHCTVIEWESGVKYEIKDLKLGRKQCSLVCSCISFCLDSLLAPAPGSLERKKNFITQLCKNTKTKTFINSVTILKSKTIRKRGTIRNVNKLSQKAQKLSHSGIAQPQIFFWFKNHKGSFSRNLLLRGTPDIPGVMQAFMVI